MARALVINMPSGRVDFTENVVSGQVRYDARGSLAALAEFHDWILDRYPREGYGTWISEPAPVETGEGLYSLSASHATSC